MTDERGDAVTRYTITAIVLHWTIAALVILNVILAFGSEWADWGMIPTHKGLGIAVLLLSVARLIWRLTHRPPPLARSISGWQRIAGHATHYAFYFLIIALPLSGWWFSSSAEQRRPLTFLGLFDIPYLPVAQGGPLGGVLHDAHVYMGWVATALILLHVAAALRHHLVLRDNTLARIAPAIGAPAQNG